jgi:hypothetical protein
MQKKSFHNLWNLFLVDLASLDTAIEICNTQKISTPRQGDQTGLWNKIAQNEAQHFFAKINM